MTGPSSVVQSGPVGTAGTLLDELRADPGRAPTRPHAELLRAMARFGVDLTRPHAAAVLSYEGTARTAWRTALSWLDLPARQDRDHEELGWMVLPAHDAEVGRELARVRAKLAGMVGSDVPVFAAAGRVVVDNGRDSAETASSFAEAGAVLALLRHRGEGVQLLHADTGLAGLLLAVPRPRLESFARAELGPLLDRPELLATLAAWLETNGSRAAVAARINVHRNSVGYRMDRVRELLGLRGNPPERMWRLHAAVVAREVLSAIPDSGRQVPSTGGPADTPTGHTPRRATARR